MRRPLAMSLIIAFTASGVTSTAFAQVNASPVDIKNVKLGMSLDEAGKILEAQNYIVKKTSNQFFTYPYQIAGQAKEEAFGHHSQSFIASKKDGNDIIHLSTFGHPEINEIVVIARALKYPDEGTKPIWEQVKSQISDKYGAPHAKDEFKKYQLKPNPWLSYEWNSKGKKRGRGLSKAVNVLGAVSETNYEAPQPECTLPERVIGKHFGQDFDFNYAVNLSEAYSNSYSTYFSYVDNYMQVTANGNVAEGRSYGPTLERTTVQTRQASDDVLYTTGCRTVFFIRGDIRDSSEEVNKLMFIMMDHKAMKKHDKALKSWKDEQAVIMQKKVVEKIKALQSTAPDVDL